MAIRVLVVDDSVVIRRLLTTIIEEDPDLEVAGVAANGAIAVQRVRQLRPDVVTLDVEMPELDGLGALAQIRPEFPNLPIVMFSTVTERGAAATLDALTRGASDYVTKPANVGSVTVAIERVRAELVPKLKALCNRAPAPKPAAPVARPAAVEARRRIARVRPPELVVIGSSTGGPNALGDVLGGLPAGLSVPIVIAQHMPPVFTRLLAERLDANSELTVHEARAGMRIEPGHAYVAPGDHHLTVERRGTQLTLATNQDAPVNFCRPAVDVLFRSVAAITGDVVAVVLTGMGADGRDGCAALRAAGAAILVQDEASSVVWGMPGAVAGAGLADEVLALGAVGPRLTALVAGVHRPTAVSAAGQ